MLARIPDRFVRRDIATQYLLCAVDESVVAFALMDISQAKLSLFVPE